MVTMRSKRSWCPSGCSTRSRHGATPPARCVSFVIRCRSAPTKLLSALCPSSATIWRGALRSCCASGPAWTRESRLSWSSASRRPPDWAADRATRRRRWWPPTPSGNWAGRARLWPSWLRNWGATYRFSSAAAAAVCRGRGERVEAVSGLAPLHFVVVRPPVGLSTAEVYAHCKAAQTAAAQRAAGRCAARRRCPEPEKSCLQPVARGGRIAVPLDRTAPARTGPAGLPGGPNDRQRDELFWDLPSCPARAPGCQTLAGEGLRSGLCRQRVQLNASS